MINNFNVIDNFLQFEEGTFYKFELLVRNTDGENIYLIASSYVPRKSSDETIQYFTGPNPTQGRYAFRLTTGGASALTNVGNYITSKWLKLYQEAGYINTNNLSGKVTAYMLMEANWSGFRDSPNANDGYAKYAVGGPTLELFVESYNKVYTSKTIEIKVEELAYDVKWSDGSFGAYNIMGIQPNKNLYVIASSAQAQAMWIASPTCLPYNTTNKNALMCAIYNRDLGWAPLESVSAGFRPIICLKDTVKLEKQADGNYKIVE